MEEVDFEYSSNIYIHRIYGEVLVANRKIQEAMKVFDELDEADNSSSAKIGKAKCLILCGDYEQAKEMIEDVLEDKVQDFGALALLDVINAHLADKYIEALNDDRNLDTVIKLGWCYYQQREFKKGIKLLDDFDDRKEYDYVNLRCRLYLADDDYEKAYPWACDWLKLIEESVDDGSREMIQIDILHAMKKPDYSVDQCTTKCPEAILWQKYCFLEKFLDSLPKKSQILDRFLFLLLSKE
mgnify:CR=1 FL=1